MHIRRLTSFFQPGKYPVSDKPLILFFILLFLLPVYACREARPDYHTLDFGVFQLTVPGDWELFSENGMDSYVGGLTDGKDSLWFDYGWYSTELGAYPDTNSLYARATINGYEAIFRISKNRQTGSVAMSIPQVIKNNKFYISGEHLSDPEAVIAMLKTLRFKGSDTTKNSALVFTDFDKYGGRSGSYVFENYCAGCHNRFKDATGPALNSQLLSQRTDEWLMQFFTNREKVAGDSLVLKRSQQYGGGYGCVIISDELSPSELKNIIAFIRNSVYSCK